MHFTADKNTFLLQLKKSFAIVKKSDVNPIYENILIECNNDDVCLYTLNEIIAIKSIVNKGVKIESTGKCMLNAQIFYKIIDKLSDNTFSFETIDDNMVKITSGSFVANINLFSYEEINIFDFETSEFNNTISGVFLKEINDKLLKIIPASKILETSPFRGVLLDTSRTENLIEAVATDSYHLGCISQKFSGDKFRIIVNSEIIKILHTQNTNSEDLLISLKNNRLLVKIADTLYNCSLIEGAYPNTNKIIEAQYQFNFVVNRSIFINAIDKAIALSDDSSSTPIVNLTVLDHLLNIVGHNVEKGSSNEDIDVTSNIDSKIKILLNASNLLSLIKNIDTENVLFKLNGSFSPVIINNENNSNYISLILPIRRS
ncbi:MAG: DNA polymerase III subunit beta [Mycoplasmataceae bacterium]|jgi:DNA polymerase-3 subunit beta|nr:DNA polymerase III subunit beta [Mycoplasmataceae bacterium]